MTRRIVIFLLAALCATAHAQTIRTLGYNSTNGQVVAATNVVWTNAFSFSTNTVAAQVRTNLGLGASDDVVFTSIIVGSANAAQPKIQAGSGFVGVYDPIDSEYLLKLTSDSDAVEINNQWNDAAVRSNLGLGLTALTETSNVGMMRALSGSTNTNHPFSGSVSVVGTNNTNTLVFSNGILQSVQ